MAKGARAFDYMVINDDLDLAVAELQKVIRHRKSTDSGATRWPVSRRAYTAFPMIEALKDDAIVTKVGGRFRLTTLIQKRRVELMDGARALVDRKPGMTDMEVVIQEILQDKITLEVDDTEDDSESAY